MRENIDLVLLLLLLLPAFSSPLLLLLLLLKDHLREMMLKEQQMNSFAAEDSTEHNQLPDDVVGECVLAMLTCPLTHSPTFSCTAASYWLARRLPVSDQCKLELLSAHCPTVRIRRGLQMLSVSPIISVSVYSVTWFIRL